MNIIDCFHQKFKTDSITTLGYILVNLPIFNTKLFKKMPQIYNFNFLLFIINMKCAERLLANEYKRYRTPRKRKLSA